MGWLRLVGSLKSYVSFAEYRLTFAVIVQSFGSRFEVIWQSFGSLFAQVILQSFSNDFALIFQSSRAAGVYGAIRDSRIARYVIHASRRVRDSRIASRDT